MKGKILITGCNGQLGMELSKLLPAAIQTNRANLDITDSDAVQAFVREKNIDTIINCAAYTAVDRAEDEPEVAEKVNALGPQNLAKSGAKIIHISTDYVFDGTSYKPYETEDKTNPISVYGKTKLDGEKAVLKYASKAVIIRTAWLYSSHGDNFVKKICQLAAKRDEIKVVYDQIGTPTFAEDLAKTIVSILPQLNWIDKKIYHFTNEGVCSWYDFATAIVELSKLTCKVNPIQSSEYPTKAPRPYYSVLSKEKIKRSFELKISHWKESLAKCLKQF